MPGEVHALVGQNGSGKSTLIKLLGGYVQADHGSDVRLGGEHVDLWHLSSAERDRIRIVHQDLGLVPTLVDGREPRPRTWLRPRFRRSHPLAS